MKIIIYVVHNQHEHIQIIYLFIQKIFRVGRFVFIEISSLLMNTNVIIGNKIRVQKKEILLAGFLFLLKKVKDELFLA